MALNLCGFLFQMTASRALGVGAYGVFYSLAALVMIAGLPGALASPIIVRAVAELRARDERHVSVLERDVARAVGAASFIYIAFGIALAPLIARFLHVPVWTISLAGVLAAAGLWSGAFRAIAQGMQAFGVFSLSSAVEGAAKVLALAMMMLLGFGVFGGLCGLLAGTLCGLAVVLWFLGRHSGGSEHRCTYDWQNIRSSTLGAGALMLATTVVGSVDVLVVKHFFDAHEAGLYAAAALGGKTVLFASAFLPTVLLPSVTHGHTKGERTRDLLWYAIAAFLAVAAVGMLVLSVWGKLFIHILVGSSYDGSIALLLPYAAAMLIFSLTSILAYYGIGKGRVAFAAPLSAGVVLTVGVMIFFHPSTAAVVDVLLAGNAATCVAVGWSILAQATSRPSALRKRIAVIGPLPWTDAIPGGPSYDTAAYAQRFCELGFTVEVWTKKPVPISACSSPPCPTFGVKHVWNRGPLSWLSIALYALRERPAAIHFQHAAFVLGDGALGEISSMLLCIALRAMRIPCAVTCNDVPRRAQVTREYVRLHRFGLPAPLVLIGLRSLFRTFGCCARWVIAHESAVAETLVADYGVPRRKILMLPHRPGSVHVHSSISPRLRNGISEETRVLLHFGFASPYKGIEVLLDAMEAFANANLNIVLLLGAGPHPKRAGAPEYEAYYSSLMLHADALPNVRNLGFLPDDRVEELLKCADLGVFPYFECQGTSGPVNECISQGVPVIVSKPISRVIPCFEAGVFEPTPQALAATSVRFFSDSGFARRIRTECAARRSSYAWSNEHDSRVRVAYRAMMTADSRDLGPAGATA